MDEERRRRRRDARLDPEDSEARAQLAREYQRIEPIRTERLSLSVFPQTTQDGDPFVMAAGGGEDLLGDRLRRAFNWQDRAEGSS